MNAPWTSEEVTAIVSDYFDMLAKELRGELYEKKAHRERLIEALRNRSHPSIEFKHANISAILYELGFPAIRGYKPRSNYQDLLAREVEARIEADSALRDLAALAVDSPPKSQALDPVETTVFVAPPPLAGRRAVYERSQPVKRVGRRFDFLAREARNRSLGEAGEQFVLQAEDQRLRAAGRKVLANRIEHVAQTQGDGLGYDVLSFDESGAERLIEVKTTNFGPYTPFFATANEVDVSRELSHQYFLYRVFDFRDRPRIFSLSGDLSLRVTLTPIAYRASLG
jgi:hypothetical protein